MKQAADELAYIVRRVVSGYATENDRATLVYFADQIDAGTLDADLVALARQLRHLAKYAGKDKTT